MTRKLTLQALVAAFMITAAADAATFGIRLIQNDHPSPTLFSCKVVVEEGRYLDVRRLVIEDDNWKAARLVLPAGRRGPCSATVPPGWSLGSVSPVDGTRLPSHGKRHAESRLFPVPRRRRKTQRPTRRRGPATRPIRIRMTHPTTAIHLVSSVIPPGAPLRS